MDLPTVTSSRVVVGGVGDSTSSTHGSGSSSSTSSSMSLTSSAAASSSSLGMSRLPPPPPPPQAMMVSELLAAQSQVQLMSALAGAAAAAGAAATATGAYMPIDLMSVFHQPTSYMMSAANAMQQCVVGSQMCACMYSPNQPCSLPHPPGAYSSAAGGGLISLVQSINSANARLAQCAMQYAAQPSASSTAVTPTTTSGNPTTTPSTTSSSQQTIVGSRRYARGVAADVQIPLGDCADVGDPRMRSELLRDIRLARRQTTTIPTLRSTLERLKRRVEHSRLEQHLRRNSSPADSQPTVSSSPDSTTVVVADSREPTPLQESASSTMALVDVGSPSEEPRTKIRRLQRDSSEEAVLDGNENVPSSRSSVEQVSRSTPPTPNSIQSPSDSIEPELSFSTELSTSSSSSTSASTSTSSSRLQSDGETYVHPAPSTSSSSQHVTGLVPSTSSSASTAAVVAAAAAAQLCSISSRGCPQQQQQRVGATAPSSTTTSTQQQQQHQPMCCCQNISRSVLSQATTAHLLATAAAAAASSTSTTAARVYQQQQQQQQRSAATSQQHQQQHPAGCGCQNMPMNMPTHHPATMLMNSSLMNQPILSFPTVSVQPNVASAPAQQPQPPPQATNHPFFNGLPQSPSNAAVAAMYAQIAGHQQASLSAHQQLRALNEAIFNSLRQHQQHQQQQQQHQQQLMQLATARQVGAGMYLVPGATMQPAPQTPQAFYAHLNMNMMVNVFPHDVMGSMERPVLERHHMFTAPTTEPQPVGASHHEIETCSSKQPFVKDIEAPAEETERCTVCLCDFETGEEVRSLRCAHIFHPNCIDRWLIYNKKCPVCRLDLDKPIIVEVNESVAA